MDVHTPGGRAGFPASYMMREVAKNMLMCVPGVTAIRKRIFSRENDPLEKVFDHHGTQWRLFKKALEISGVELSGSDVIELGSGPVLGNAIYFIANGAASYTACDRYNLLRTDKAVKNAYRELIGRLPIEQRERCQRLVAPDSSSHVFDSRVRSVVTMVEELGSGLPASGYDLVVSFNMLELVNDVGRALSGVRHILKPGGVMIHRVDLSNHGACDAVHSLAHLTVPRPIWLLMGSRRALPNRVRPSEFLAIADKLGFCTLQYEVTTRLDEAQVDDARAHLLREFADCAVEDLATLDFVWVARSPV